MNIAESMYRKYLDSSVSYIQKNLVSADTKMVQLSARSDFQEHADGAPIEENIFYALLLLRTKGHEAIFEARWRLQLLLRYQNKDGSFPALMSDLGAPGPDWGSSFKIGLALYQIIRDFHLVLGQELMSALQRAISSQRAWCAEILKKTHSDELALLYFCSSDTIEHVSSATQAVESFAASSDLFDLQSSGLILSAIASSPLAPLPIVAESLAKMSSLWRRADMHFIGPELTKQFVGHDPAVLSAHIFFSLRLQLPIVQKIPNWPKRSLFILALLYPIWSQEVESGFSGEAAAPSGSVVGSREVRTASWSLGSQNQHKKRGWFPLSICSVSGWDCTGAFFGYELISATLSPELPNRIECLFRMEPEADASEKDTGRDPDFALGSFYIQKQPGCGFFSHLAKPLTYYAAGDLILFGRCAPGEAPDCSSLAITIPELQDLSGYYFRVRSGDRPGQLRLNSAHAMVEPGGYDWILDFGHPKGARPNQIVVTISV